MTIYVIIVGVPSLIAILIWLWKGIRFFSEHLMYSNLEIGSKEGIEGTTQFGETRIKLAYNGSNSLFSTRFTPEVHFEISLSEEKGSCLFAGCFWVPN